MDIGFDSRWWDGRLPANHRFVFAIQKATEGDSFQSQQFPGQIAAIRAGGLIDGSFHFHRLASNPANAAKMYYDWVMGTGRDCLIMPVADFEDTRARPSLQLVNHMWDTVQAIEDEFGRMCMIYTARWWWDTMAKPYVQSQHGFYERPLWEADPPPTSPIAGEWATRAIRQIALDIVEPGFNAGIDVNETEILNELMDNDSEPLPGEPIRIELRVPTSVQVDIIEL